MYSSKKEVDNHVRTAFAKIRSEKDRALRGFTVAKLYVKIKEYTSAEQYLCSYLSVKEDNDQAHKMLGQCYQAMKQPAKALQAFQRSLQLNPKQPELLGDVCRMLVDDDQLNANKAKYWCDLAESEKVENDSVYALRLKLMNMSNVNGNEIESILQKEITTRPNDVNPRVRLVRHYLNQKRVLDAFKYVHDFEMQQNDSFNNSGEWYNTVWLVLSKYEQLTDAKKDWEFWLLVAMCLERLVFISFISCETAGLSGGAIVTETANWLFRFDQYLFKVAQLSEKFNAQRELVRLFLDHYRGQLLLHAVGLLFKRELMQKKNKWNETMRLTLPLLLLAFHTEPKENNEPWMKHCDEKSAHLIQMWYREGAFRCAQAGRILLSCIKDDEKENNRSQINSVFGTQPAGLWSNADELLAQVRQTCVDKQWRHNVFAQLFCNSDQKLKEQTSLLSKEPNLAEPAFILPSIAILEEYEEVAQYLRPQSYRHMVYLCLGRSNLAHLRANYFNGLNFSTSNLSFCGAESLNQLDIDSFLYAGVIAAKRSLQVNYEISDCYNSQSNQNAIGRPTILPFALMQEDLGSEEQRNWWTVAFKVYKNLVKGDNNAQMRSDLQAGIEAVRGINGPKMDMIIVFKLGKIFEERSKDIRKPVDRSFTEARTETLYTHGLKMLKLHGRGVLEPFRKTFKYAKSNSNAVDRETNEIAEMAVLYLSDRMLKKAQYEEFIEEMNGVPLPFATYKQAEAYRKLEEANTTSKSSKQRCSERAAECLQQTLNLLKSTKFDSNHPLNATIHTEIKRLQKASNKKFNEEDNDDYNLITDTGTSGGAAHNNSSTYEDAETEFFSPSLNRSGRRDVVASIIAAAQQATPKHYNDELESLVKQIATTMCLVKEELVCNIKPEVLSMRQEIVSLKDKVTQLEDAMKKLSTGSSPPSRDDGSNVLDDLYIIEDALQNQFYPQHNQQATSNLFPNVAGNNPATPNAYASGGGVGGSGLQQVQSQPRIHTPNALQMQQQAAVAAAAAAYNSPIFNPNYPLNYYPPSFMLAQQGAANASNSLLGQRSQMGLPYLEAGTAVNFNVPPSAPWPSQPPTASAAVPAQSTDVRANNMYSLINPQQPVVGLLPQANTALPSGLNLPTVPAPPVGLAASSTSTATTATTMTSFNKALNNQPVEKGPPANVVITSSDPLPNPKSVTQLQQQQSTLSVTIPSHHIKPSLVQAPEINAPATAAASSSTVPINSSSSALNLSNTFGNNTFGLSSGSTFNFGSMSNDTGNATTNFINTFSFKPAIEQALAAANNSSLNGSTVKEDEAPAAPNESASSDLNKSLDPDNVEYDPRPDFQPIIPLPDEIEVRTGEEDEEVTFSEHGKLYRFVDKEWKERGVGTLKILKGKDGHSRILMRRDQTHKICANHKITHDIKLTPKPEKNGHTWAAPDFADGEVRSEIFYLRFKLAETSKNFEKAFKQAQKEDEDAEAQSAGGNEVSSTTSTTGTASQQPPFALAKSSATSFATSTPSVKKENTENSKAAPEQPKQQQTQPFGIISSTNTTPSKPLFGNLNLGPKTTSTATSTTSSTSTMTSTPNIFANFTFGTTTASLGSNNPASNSVATPFSNLFSSPSQASASPFNIANLPAFGEISTKTADSTTAVNNLYKSNASDTEDEYVPTAQFKPVIPLPDLVEIQTGEENYKTLFEHRAKLLRFDKETREWKERGLGNIRILQHKDDLDDVRLVMRRDQIHKLCCNQRLYKDLEFKYAKNSLTALQWSGHDYSEGELITESLTLRFKTPEICKEFYEILLKAQEKMSDKAKMQVDKQIGEESTKKETTVKADRTNVAKTETKGFGDAFKPKAGSWTCNGCYIVNTSDKLYCMSCETPKDDTVPKKESTTMGSSLFGAGINAPSTKSTFTFGFGNATAAATNPTTTTAPTPSAIFGVGVGSATKGFALPSISNSTTVTPAPTSANDFGDKFKPKAGSWDCKDCYTNNQADKIYCIACEAPKDSTIPKKESSNSNEGNKNLLALSDPTKKFTFGFPAAGNNAVLKPAEPAPSSAATLPTLSKPTFTFSLQSTAMTAPAMPSNANSGVGNVLSGGSTIFSSLNKKDFTFSMTPKSIETTTSLTAAGEDADAGDADDSSHLHEEEENNTYFTPVIPLPDKIDVKTGEENEEVLYQHRAKLYRFASGEWKERGIGDVKILQHKGTKKLRVVMRRDQVHKICLNHVLNDEVEYKRKDEKSWLFVVNDFSEGEVQLEQLSLRFKTKDIAEEFMAAVKDALTKTENKEEEALNGHTENEKKTEAKEDEEKDLLPKWSLVQPELKLPNKIKSEKITEVIKPSPQPLSPANRLNLLKQSALVSPAGGKESVTIPSPASTVDNKNEKASSPVTFSFTGALKANEEGKTQTPAPGGFLFGNSNVTSGPASTFGSSIFGGKQPQPTFGLAPSIFQTPTITESSGEVDVQKTSNEEPKLIFGSKPVFGGINLNTTTPSTTSIFGGVAAKEESKIPSFGSLASSISSPIFGNVSTPTNTANSGQSIFGSGSTNNGGTPIFGATEPFSGFTGTDVNKNRSIFGGAVNLTKSASNESHNNNNADSTKAGPFPDFILKGGGLDFASLAAASNNKEATKSPEKPGPDGFIGLTNQDAFSSFSKLKPPNSETNANNGDDDQGGDAANDENYDPHYEAIIPLPKEIVVSTGEEEEEKLFSERATLFRYDAENKEWKERGVGDVKILKHNSLNRYRLVLRREQVHKLVLNFAITEDFKFNNMNNNPKSFVFVGMNFAESDSGDYEQLAVRFKNPDLAKEFGKTLQKCMEIVQKQSAEQQSNA